QHTARRLFPPFYNRPPTPLPPSPSLTSLLRPTFSATTSRPTTPDSSDVEVQLTKSARRAAPVPRAVPKIPTYEYYGFAMYLASCAAFLLYLVWAYVPAPVLHQMGIHYYPNRWWALAVPCWLSVLVVYIYFALASYNTTRLTLPLPSYENLVDETGHVAVVDHGTHAIAAHHTPDPLRFAPCHHVEWPSYWAVSTDAVLDVPIGGVCEVLYGRGD
ncbi:PIG-P-domain-containing protein, partial [Periconia macrospinosa]